MFVGIGKEYKELKEKQVLDLFSGGKDVSVALLLDRLEHKLLLCILVFFNGSNDYATALS